MKDGAKDNQTRFKRFQRWHKTIAGFASMAVIALLIAYAFASLAIDRGNLWFYLLTLIFVILTIQNVFGFLAVLLRNIRAY